MIEFSQSNELPIEFLVRKTFSRTDSNSKGPSLTTDEFAEQIDAMMKQEHEDVILLDHSLPDTPLDFDLDSISDLLEHPTSSTTSFTQPLNIHDLSPPSSAFTTHTSSRSNTATSPYSSLGISPKFTTLSIHPYPSYSLQPNPHEEPVLATSYPFELQMRPNSHVSDVKRFRSASMNEGSAYPQAESKRDLDLFDPYRFKPSAYVHRLPHENKPSLTLPSQTLYSLNQCSGLETTPPTTRKRLSLVDFPVEEVKDDPVSPDVTIEQPSDADLWSDIEQNSSDHIQENDLTSDDDTAVSIDDQTEAGVHPSSSLFWQYNVQSKGPKTKRVLYLKERDPHMHREFSDPVYQIKLTQTKGQSLNKLRKGDGNDVTPNPMKLYQLGKQIRDLSNNTSSVYHGIYHVDHQINSNDTAEVKKEKNKIASRACRLRKKAQHEANKLKLHGLNEEHKALIDVIASIKWIILQRFQNGPRNPSSPALEDSLDQLIAAKCSKPVAGNSDGFVQTVINEMEQLYTLKQSRHA